jgi:hypothetical protein
LGIVDGHRYTIYKLEALGKRVVQGFQLVRARSVTIKGFKGILMIRHIRLAEQLYSATYCIGEKDERIDYMKKTP